MSETLTSSSLSDPVDAATVDHVDDFAEQSLQYLPLRLGMATAITGVIIFAGLVQIGIVWACMISTAEFFWTTRSKRLLARRSPMNRADYLTMAFLNLVLVITYMLLAILLVLQQSPLMVMAAVIWVAGGFFACVLVLVPDRLMMATTYGPSVVAMIGVINLIDWNWRGGEVTPDSALTLAISLFFSVFVVRALVTAGDFQKRAYADKQLLEERRRAAERASVNKTAFLARLSHEIRTPLNGVLGCASLLAETDLDARQRYLAEQVTQSGESLLTVLNDVLDISKIEIGGVELDDGPFDLVQMFEDAVNLSVPEAEHRGVQLYTHADSRLPAEILGDASRMRQITINLLNNAV
ncbi:MAG: histidine kinase dimerization/phospho-acceptor domain-containing protein, partial [Pseudomonadota bacterium]